VDVAGDAKKWISANKGVIQVDVAFVFVFVESCLTFNR
jgi:hypothetical protein